MAAHGDEDTEGIEYLRQRVSGLRLPRHIAIVMDGNGRWAEQRGLPRVQGHFEGRKATKRTVRACAAIGIEVLSLYAFSVENWQRPPEEVNAILRLIATALEEELDELDANNVRFRASGRLHEIPEYLRQALRRGEERTADNTGLILNLCVNYGGRAEIVDAARAIAAKAAAGQLDPQTIDEATFSRHLYQPDLPDPDLLLRPGGETRVSNFLLWQIAYSEVIILPVLWPDFREEHLADALVEYSRRQRRFGRVAAAE